MDIYSKEGSKVIYDQPNNGYENQQIVARESLELNKEYTIADIEVHDFTSYVTFEEVPGAYNTVLFSNVEIIDNKGKDVYFNDVEENQEVFGLVFGHGVVASVWKDSFYSFEVLYDNGHTVPYTPEGYPAWANKGFQTVFYKIDIDLMEMDFQSSDKDELSPKKIIKLRAKNKLEVKCPSEIWQPVGKCPAYVIEQYLEEGKLNRFRKIKGETNES